MKRRKVQKTSLWILFIALVCLTHSCKRDKGKAATQDPPLVSVITVQAKNVPVTLEHIAQTQSSRLVNIQARVSGFLEKRVYTEGEIVKEGQVLFEMDKKPFLAQLHAAEAALAKQKAAMETARLNLARTEPLTKLNALSQKDLDDAIGSFDSSSASVEQAKAQLETAKLNLSYCTITSPLFGITSAALQQDGTYLNVADSQLTTVAQLSPIWVNFSISENELQQFRDQVAKGLMIAPKRDEFEVEVILVNGTPFPHKGKITFTEPYYNPQTGTFLIRGTVENPDGILRPNQFVRARISGAIRPNAILIPQRAVQQSSKGNYVWVLDKGGIVSLRPVTVGEWNEKDWFINEGLKSGEIVVVDGGFNLQPGVKVRVKALEEKASNKESKKGKN